MREETCVPNPEYLIKSIAEQGYSLETSIADLIDNSISADAGRIEVLINTQQTPFVLFIADDGGGMTAEELKRNMQFPSSSMETGRDPIDLGRFGLGLKTASFAQTRCFTVITRKKNTISWHARTWDVEHLKASGRWEILINDTSEIDALLSQYQQLTTGFLNAYNDYTPNTIVVWQGLYKFDNGLAGQDKSELLQKQLTQVTREYLQLIFHRFLSRTGNTLHIRLNNEQLQPFDPFPDAARNISVQQKLLLGNNLRLEGFVLPNRSIQESKGESLWTLSHKSLIDMEGIYIYRADRLIVFGGWIGLIKSAPRLQLARLKVEIGNGVDHLFHLNVAKSSIIIPFSEQFAFCRYVTELKIEAEKEFYNYDTRPTPVGSRQKNIFRKIPVKNGMALEIDQEFPLLQQFAASLDNDQQKRLRIILRMITTAVNKIKKVHAEENYSTWLENDNLSAADLNDSIRQMMENGISAKYLLEEILPGMGLSISSLPESVLQLLKEK